MQNFENPLFIIPISSGVIFVITGYIMLKFPPKKINPLYGYRTPNSMKNQERWDFAQRYSALEMIKCGALMCFVGLLGLIVYPDHMLAMFLGLGLLFLIVILLFIRVERAISRKFKQEQ